MNPYSVVLSLKLCKQAIHNSAVALIGTLKTGTSDVIVRATCRH